MSQRVNITGVNTSKLPKLSAQEAEEMLKLIKNGRADMREKFILANMRLVLSMVQRFKCEDKADDLFQVGMLGLIKALDNFDVTLNVRFSTYAVPMILGEIRRFLRDSSALKVGRGLRDVAYRAMQARDRLEYQKNEEASLLEIADEIKVPYKEVVCALDAIAEPVSIFDSVYSDGEDSVLIVDQISSGENENSLLDSMTLKEELKKLPERERSVIELRYFQGKTQMEISKELTMSQAQVSRLEKSAIERLRGAFLYGE